MIDLFWLKIREIDLMNRKTYYDAEPWYQREKTVDWYQQMPTTNDSVKNLLRKMINGGSIVTEVACGGGWLAEYIATLKPKAYRGFDFAETAVKNANKRLRSELSLACFQGDALLHTSYSPDTNVIVAHQFFHCLLGADRVRWLTICKAILEPNSGSLAISSMIGLPASVRDTVDEKTRINKPGNRYYAEDHEIQDELHSVGFKIIDIVYPELHSGIYKAVI